jgi:hypothetical protein
MLGSLNFSHCVGDPVAPPGIIAVGTEGAWPVVQVWLSCIGHLLRTSDGSSDSGNSEEQGREWLCSLCSLDAHILIRAETSVQDHVSNLGISVRVIGSTTVDWTARETALRRLKALWLLRSKYFRTPAF